MKNSSETPDKYVFGDDLDLGMIQKKSFQELSMLDSDDFGDLDDEYTEYSAYAMVPT